MADYHQQEVNLVFCVFRRDQSSVQVKTWSFSRQCSVMWPDERVFHGEGELILSFSYRSLSLMQPTSETATPRGPPTTSTTRRLDLLLAARQTVGKLFLHRVFLVAGLLPPAVGHNKTCKMFIRLHRRRCWAAVEGQTGTRLVWFTVCLVAF